MLQEKNKYVCGCCLNTRHRLISAADARLMIYAKDKYTLDDAVIFSKIIKGILSYEFAEKMTYDQAVEHYAGSKQNALMYENASNTTWESSSSRENHSLALDFIFRDILNIKEHCQACSLSLTKKICNSNIDSVEALEIAMSEFAISIIARNKRDRYKTLNKG